ncbi:MAG TPA: hypothetical protein P5186_05375 [Candidatus Paceibacterota bacterium]|nr:hypothetical protein [Verrucomicrobiota bacterium]HRY47458.1 hypothetical protein [Candidatus Paceibacterota bacterium]HSA00546.1 hypothetical protein [Candidatus Paceibacterota bacterium]
MARLLKSKWMVIVMGMITYAATTFLIWPPLKELAPRPTPEKRTEDERILAAWTLRHPELEQLMAELRRRKDTLEQREQQLNELALRLQNERAEINSITQSVGRLQGEFDRNVVRVKEEEAANLKKLAKLYAAMTPEGASAVIRELPDEQAVKVLMMMKEAESAPILEILAKAGAGEARRVAALSEKIRLSLARTQPKTSNP